jgi:hypothetical protein
MLAPLVAEIAIERGLNTTHRAPVRWTEHEHHRIPDQGRQRESERRTPPACTGIIVTIFVGSKLHAITAEDALRWASEVLSTTVDDLDRQYGTHEVETVLRTAREWSRRHDSGRLRVREEVRAEPEPGSNQHAPDHERVRAHPQAEDDRSGQR